MSKVNLRDLYPAYYKKDQFIDVSDEVAVVFTESEREEQNYQRYVRYHKAYYSLDAGDWIEKEILFPCPSLEAFMEHTSKMGRIYSALAALSDKQRRRVYSRYILNMSVAAIARREGVSEKNVRLIINRGLRSMQKYLKKFC